jgi:hypothetical protein
LPVLNLPLHIHVMVGAVRNFHQPFFIPGQGVSLIKGRYLAKIG